MDVSLVIVSNDYDWEGLYINGIIVFQTHRLTSSDILFYLKGHTLVDYNTKVCDTEWFEDQNDFPRRLSEVKIKETIEKG